VCHNQPLKALHDFRCECYRAVVIVALRLRGLENRNCGGQFNKTWGDYRLGQGEVENDLEYACQLFCASESEITQSSRSVVARCCNCRSVHKMH
jgi:hypothetical protein